MKVITPDFGQQKKTPQEQVSDLATQHIPELVSEGSYDQAVFICANENQMMFLTNLGPAELNLLIDVAKQYVLMGE